MRIWGNDMMTSTTGFYKIPKVFFYNKLFLDLSGESKLLYSYIFDKMSLCDSHHWIDKVGRYYIMASVKEFAALLKMTTDDANRFLSELEGFDLIEVSGHVPSMELQIYPKDITILEKNN